VANEVSLFYGKIVSAARMHNSVHPCGDSLLSQWPVRPPGCYSWIEKSCLMDGLKFSQKTKTDRRAKVARSCAPRSFPEAWSLHKVSKSYRPRLSDRLSLLYLGARRLHTATLIAPIPKRINVESSGTRVATKPCHKVDGMLPV
jgi:hypothetical protein